MECGEPIRIKGISDGNGHEFCNNLCRVLFEKRSRIQASASKVAPKSDSPRFLDEIRSAYQNLSTSPANPYLTTEPVDPIEQDARKGMLLRSIPISIGYFLVVSLCLLGIEFLKSRTDGYQSAYWPLLLAPAIATFFLARDRGRNPYFWTLFALSLFLARWSALLPALAFLLPSERKFDELVAKLRKVEPEPTKSNWKGRWLEYRRPRYLVPFAVLAALLLLNLTIILGFRGVVIWLLASIVVLGLFESIFLRIEKAVVAWALSVILLSIHMDLWRLYADESLTKNPYLVGFNPRSTAKFMVPVRHDVRSAEEILSPDHERTEQRGELKYSSWKLRKMLMYQVHPLLETCYEPIETHVRRRIESDGVANLSNPWTGHRDVCANMMADHLVWSSDSMVVARDGVITYLTSKDMGFSVQLFEGDKRNWFASKTRSR
jgi:hypothetical protein